MTSPVFTSPLSRADYFKVVEFNVAYLSALPVTPERTQQIAALRLGAELYSPPFSSAYELLMSTDASSGNCGTPAATESSPTVDESQISTTHAGVIGDEW